MKKLVALLLLAFVVCSFCGCSIQVSPNRESQETSASADTETLTEATSSAVTQTDKVTDTTQAALDYKSEYRRLIQQYEDTYGEIRHFDEDERGYVSGVCFLKIVDFNADGTEELVLVYREKDTGFFESVIFTVFDNKVTQVRNADFIFNHGTSVQPYISFFTKDGKVYGKDIQMLWGDNIDMTYNYITLEGDAMAVAKTFEFTETETEIKDPYIDGEYVTVDEFYEEYALWDTEELQRDYEFYSLDVYDDEGYNALVNAVSTAKAALGY